MFNWAKQQLANVAGTEEPIYGPSAIQTVTEQAKTTPYTELKKEDLRWKVQDSTNVETQQFYLWSESGHIGLAQVIYSNVMGIRTAAQFNSKIIYPDGRPSLWCSTPLKNDGFSEDKYSFHADNCSLDFSEDGTYYTIKSSTSNECIVNLKVKRSTPGFVAGENGTSFFGTDPKKPWGSMWHKFWPMCEVEGSMITKAGEVDFKGRGMYIHALQGMKPHHAGAKWNFVSFQSKDYSAVMMEFTTPASYGTTKVNVGGIVKEGEIIFAGAGHTAKHLKSKVDEKNDWPEPSEIEYRWTGKTKDGKDVTAVIEGSLGTLTDRVDVMAEVPAVIKSLLASAAGTKPYIYQFTPTLPLKLNIGGETIEQEGKLFIEATFIC